ncbi:ankyrin repeat-containing domain protein, partial [Baffinella frigidus]
SPLHEAADYSHRGRKAMVLLLLKHGADASPKDKDGLTPLHWAASHGRTAVVVLLIQHGAEVS